MSTEIKVVGFSGATYSYWTTDEGSMWLDVPANYLWITWTSQGWTIKYAGEADALATRFGNHERWAEAVRDYGVTHVVTRINQGGVNARRAEERDIIRLHNPPMNTQHRTIDAAEQMDLAGLALIGRYGNR